MTSPTVNNFKIKCNVRYDGSFCKENNLETNNISLFFKPNASAQLILFIKPLSGVSDQWVTNSTQRNYLTFVKFEWKSQIGRGKTKFKYISLSNLKLEKSKSKES